uniref:Uncharacterized protein n=1 Tax=Arundo donax TaxID=35708 RepID=A0A0A9BKC4_ARUDO
MFQVYSPQKKCFKSASDFSTIYCHFFLHKPLDPV